MPSPRKMPEAFEGEERKTQTDEVAIAGGNTQMDPMRPAKNREASSHCQAHADDQHEPPPGPCCEWEKTQRRKANEGAGFWTEDAINWLNAWSDHVPELIPERNVS